MRQCQLNPAEYTNVAHDLGTRCIASNGLCSAIIPSDLADFFVLQDCTKAGPPCSTSDECPLGANCVNGQCVFECNTDIACQRADPLSQCINGECVKIEPPKEEPSVSNTWIWVIVVCIIIFILLILIVFFGVKRKFS